MITKFNKFITESIRDEMKGKTKEELGKATEKILDELKSILPGFSLTLSNVKSIIHDDDLNSAMFNLQGMIGQDDGGVCGVYFSGLDDPDEQWEEGTPEQRLFWVKGYLELEATYAELENDEVDHEKQDELDGMVAEDKEEKYYVYYTYDFATYKSKHHIRIFDQYSKEKGIHGEMITEVEDTQMMKALKEVRQYLTKEQQNTLIEMMRMRSDCIILPDGKIGD